MVQSSPAKRIRWAPHKSQIEFAKTFRIPLGTLCDWEQHCRDPDQAAQANLEVTDREPDVVGRALARATEAASRCERSRLDGSRIRGRRAD